MPPLWLALHLPLLPLEAGTSPPLPGKAGAAVVVQSRVLVCDAMARQAGITAGTGVAAARMLAPGIALTQRDTERENTALALLACWAGRFTPQISLAGDSLLLEIGSCLRLFGGEQNIAAAALAGLQAQGFSATAAAAPTPQGALWLARHGGEGRVVQQGHDIPSMHRQLDALPVSVLPVKAAAALVRFGASTLAEARRLPAAALGRRIGAEAIQLLARAYGEMPDLRARFVFPQRFAQLLQLPAPVDNAAALLFAARRLTSALSGWLALRHAGVREMRLQLLHPERTVNTTEIVLQFADVTASEERFARLLRERLERLTLAAPAESIRLEANHVAARPGHNQSLFDDAAAGQEAADALLERLRARLGDRQVYRVAVHDDHRPECATRRVSLFTKTAPERCGVQSACHLPLPRPLWLLELPEPLKEVDGRPWRHGAITLLAGPERIESGWWDGGEAGSGTATGDLRRDYFIALAPDASWLWIYRECRAPGGWFLQGLFA